MTRLPQPGGRHLTTGPQLGRERHCARRLKVPFTHATFRATRLRAPRMPGRSPLPLPQGGKSSRACGTPRPHRGTKGTAASVPRAARSAPTNRYVCLAAPGVCVTRRRAGRSSSEPRRGSRSCPLPAAGLVGCCTYTTDQSRRSSPLCLAGQARLPYNPRGPEHAHRGWSRPSRPPPPPCHTYS